MCQVGKQSNINVFLVIILFYFKESKFFFVSCEMTPLWFCVSVNVRQEMLEEAQKKLMNLLNSTEGKIDK